MAQLAAAAGDALPQWLKEYEGNNESSTKTLDEFTDYRTYMDYDIKIIHTDGTFSYYSKVCEEKSGGETQTPFYVTVAASFVQLYTNNIGGEAAGLVMFDEAFNNMDEFVIVSTDGYIRTYFKPEDGIAYYNRQ